MKQKQVIIILYIIVLVMIILPVGILIHWLFFKSGIKSHFNVQNQQEVTNEYIYDFDKSEYIFASTQNEWFEVSKNGKWYDVRFNGGDVDTDVIQQFIEAGKFNEGGKEMTLSAGSITITDDGLVVISGDRCICYLDVVNKKIIKILPLEHRDTVAVNIGGRDILFLTEVIYINTNLIRIIKYCYMKQSFISLKYPVRIYIKIVLMITVKKMAAIIFLYLIQRRSTLIRMLDLFTSHIQKNIIVYIIKPEFH